MTRNEVEMDVHSRLPRRGADVGADVVAVGRMLFSDDSPRFLQQRHDGIALRRGHLEKIGHVPARNDDHMAAAKRVAVVACIRERILDDQGGLRRFVNVFVADDDVRFLQGLDTAVPDGETVAIIPAVAGG
jgi:molybdopterin converting factor small subunit